MKTDLEELAKTILFPFDSLDKQIEILEQAIIDIEHTKEIIDGISKCIINTPELNMGNYSEDQVSELNNAMIEIRQLLKTEVR